MFVTVSPVLSYICLTDLRISLRYKYGLRPAPQPRHAMGIVSRLQRAVSTIRRKSLARACNAYRIFHTHDYKRFYFADKHKEDSVEPRTTWFRVSRTGRISEVSGAPDSEGNRAIYRRAPADDSVI